MGHQRAAHLLSPYLGLRNRSDWPKGIVPFNDWGCLIVSCLDLTTSNVDPPVVRYEPNMSRQDTVTFLDGRPFRGTGLIPESDKLSIWFEDWISGKEMFERPYVKIA